jgi:regulator of protease activity HflC (stomatin/prohibitin superfamily)
MLRLGPVIERLQHEFFMPLIERCFNIMLRKGRFAELSPELEQMAGEYQVSLVSPLATAQRGVALQGINSFMAFLGNAAQFDPTILDNIDPDAAAREYADITGVQIGILRPEDEVAKIRKQRAEAQARQQQAEQAMQAQQMQAQATGMDADARKPSAEANVAQLEAQEKAQELGMM